MTERFRQEKRGLKAENDKDSSLGTGKERVRKGAVSNKRCGDLREMHGTKSLKYTRIATNKAIVSVVCCEGCRMDNCYHLHHHVTTQCPYLKRYCNDWTERECWSLEVAGRSC
jgi:hypothetical protein